MALTKSQVSALACAWSIMCYGAAATDITIGQDIDYPPYAFEDPNGNLAGFGYDIAQGMNAAGGLCADINITMVKTAWEDCWTSGRLGDKLEDGTLDACATYTHTVGARPLVADFSHGILEVNKAAGLITKLDSDGEPMVNGLSDLSGLRIVDVGGWAPTADGLDHVLNFCTDQNYASASAYTLLVAENASTNNNQEALEMILDGRADAMFVYADQAMNYIKACNDGDTTDWDCNMWQGFGTTFAYVQTGQFEYVRNGTTLAMTKKNSGIAELLNPCLDQFIQTEEYYNICNTHGLVASCYANSFFPANATSSPGPYNQRTDEHTTGCSDGYCNCPPRGIFASSAMNKRMAFTSVVLGAILWSV